MRLPCRNDDGTCRSFCSRPVCDQQELVDTPSLSSHRQPALVPPMTVSTRSSSSVGHFAGKKFIKYFNDDKLTDERDVNVVKFATHGLSWFIGQSFTPFVMPAFLVTASVRSTETMLQESRRTLVTRSGSRAPETERGWLEFKHISSHRL